MPSGGRNVALKLRCRVKASATRNLAVLKLTFAAHGAGAKGRGRRDLIAGRLRTPGRWTSRQLEHLGAGRGRQAEAGQGRVGGEQERGFEGRRDTDGWLEDPSAPVQSHTLAMTFPMNFARRPLVSRSHAGRFRTPPWRFL